jgi:hypothetical protein
MSRWRKGTLLALLFFASVAWGDDCGIFLDVLQTRHPGSKIVMEGEAKITASANGCELNTTNIRERGWKRLWCGDGRASATGVPANSMEVNYTFTTDTAQTSSTPCTGQCSSYTYNNGTYTLPGSSYGTFTERYGGVTLNFTAGEKTINGFDLNIGQTTTLNFQNQNGNPLTIGTITSTGTGQLYLKIDAPASTIKIDSFSMNNYTSGELNATNSIQIKTLKFPRYDSELVLKAPKIVIDDFKQSNDGKNSSRIVIYADEVDIANTLDLGQHAVLEVHPYTPGKPVLFKAGEIKATDSSTMILDTGNYYTRSFDIPGTSSSASIRASDENQLINLYIDGDFAPGNNPGINTTTREANAFNLPAANFRMFVNGNFIIGDGGTAFNGIFYIEGKSHFGTEMILNGALSSGNDIEIENGGQFGWDDSLNNLGDEFCSGGGEGYSYYNQYTCGIFDAPIVGYAGINIHGQKRHRFMYTHRIRTREMHGEYGCFKDHDTEVECEIMAPPPNHLEYENMYTTRDEGTQTFNSDVELTNLHYPSLVFESGAHNIHFNPQTSYKDKDIKVMLAGDVKFAGTDQNWTIESGDYFLKSLSMDNPVNVCVNGPVRIFVQGDMDWKGKFNNQCNGELFIYVGGNSRVTTFSPLPTTPTYLYTKGTTDVYKDPNSEIGYWYGSMAGEGDININDDDIEFVYDKDGAEALGYGDCDLCYSDIISGGMGMDFFCMGGVSLMNDIKVPMMATSTLSGVEVDEVHNKDLFNFTFMSTNEVIDQDGNHIRDAQTVDSGFSAGAMGMDMSMFGGKAVIYRLGDDNNVYGPTSSSNYQQLHSSSLFSMNMDMCMWLKSLTYIGHYTDSEGRKYDFIVQKCEPNVAGEQNASITGIFDGWDRDYQYAKVSANPDPNGIAQNRVITTKIYHQGFDLNVAFIPTNPPAVPSSDNIVETQFALVKINSDGTFDPHNGVISDWGYYRLNSATPVATYHFDYGITTSGNNVALKDVGAVPNAKMVFKVCADYNGTGYTIYPLETCNTAGDCDSATQTNSTCYRYFTSSDNFAIRPYGFRLFGKNEYRRAGEDFNLTLKAVDQANYDNNSSTGRMTDITAVPGYGVALSTLNLTPSIYHATDAEKAQMRSDMGLPATASVDYCPNSGTFVVVNGATTFTNGEANATLNYTEVGILDMNVSERPGAEFAIVDSDDTIDSRRYIKQSDGITDMDNISQRDLLLVIPYQFRVTGTVGTTTGANWIYISRDVNNSNVSPGVTPRMAGVITYNITALNKSGNVVQNYTKTCFPDVQTTAPRRNGLKLNVTFDLFLDSTLETTQPVNNANFYVTDSSNAPIWTLTKNQNLVAGTNKVREWISSLNFVNGSGSAKVFFNQYKDYRTPVNPFTIKVVDINTSTSWMSQPGATQIFTPATLNREIELRYGRFKISNVSTYGNKIQTNWLYQYYTGGKWVTNPDHSSATMGHFNLAKSLVGDVNVTENVLAGGVSNIQLSTTHKLPYSYKLHLAIDPWLWYNPKAKDYLDPVTAGGNNYDCLTHPCAIVEFLDNSAGWGGVANSALQGKGLGDRNNTVQMGERNVSGTQQEFKRLNW